MISSRRAVRSVLTVLSLVLTEVTHISLSEFSSHRWCRWCESRLSQVEVTERFDATCGIKITRIPSQPIERQHSFLQRNYFEAIIALQTTITTISALVDTHSRSQVHMAHADLT